MTDQEIRQQYAQICDHLAARRLKPAFEQLGKIISGSGLAIYYDEHRILSDTYQNMLRYTVEGVLDPERQKIYRRLIVSVFELADKIHEALNMKYSLSLEYSKKQAFSLTYITEPGNFLGGLEDFFLRSADLHFAGKGPSGAVTEDNDAGAKNPDPGSLKIQQKIQRYFYHTWFTDKLSVEDGVLFNKFLSSPVLPLHYKSFMVSALSLSLERYFDPQKIMLLCKTSESDEPAISNRAIAGLLLNLDKYDQRLPFYPEIAGRLKILHENPEFRGHLETTILQFIRSKGTEKLQQLLRDEILPEMIKISPNLQDKIKLDSLMEDGLFEDKNPDWEDVFKDSPGLLSKLEEFSEMQMKGDDVFMGSFSMLKSFPFFNEPVNWFIPFFPENPEISSSLDANQESMWQLAETIAQAPILCNSDKYSFCLSLPGIPKENLGMMTSAMQAEMEQVREIKADEAILDPGQKYEFLSNQYIQDLYRFYKLFPKRAGFKDVFSRKLDFHNKTVLGEAIREDRKMLRNIAEYYFAREHFAEASEIFRFMAEKEESGELYQKIAWCHQKTGDYQSALEAYLKAEFYDVNNTWNLKKTALCYRNLKKPDKALEYYLAAEKSDPENLGIQLNIGHCLLELDRYEDALKSYFKVEYLAPGNKKVWRPIGWCSFLTGKKEQAEKYFKKLMDDEPNNHDFISMGHVQWSLGKRKSALSYYQESISKDGFSEPEFIKIFEEDIPHLLDQGIDGEDIPIMLDQLRYYLEK